MSLLVPIDLSAPSRCAIGLAAHIGRTTGEDALLLHVSDGPTPLDHLARLHALASPLRDAGLVARLREVVGQPAENICLEAERRAARWVIMGTRGDWGPAAPRDPGSVARTVLARAPIPVIAVRPALARGDCWLVSGRPAHGREPRIGVVSLSGAPRPSMIALAEGLAVALSGRIVTRGEGDLSGMDLDLVIAERSDQPLDDLFGDALAALRCPVAVVSAPETPPPDAGR